MCHILPHKLIHKASTTQLEVRNFRCRVVHVDKLKRLRAGDVMLVILTIEQVLVHPSAALLEQGAALLCEGFVLHGFRHLLCSTQGAHIPESHLRIGAKVVHVHRVVLRAFHYTILIGIPTSLSIDAVVGKPGIAQHLLHLLPILGKELVVA